MRSELDARARRNPVQAPYWRGVDGCEDSEVTLRPGGLADAPACAAIYDAWVDATDWMPRIHSPEELERHYREHVMTACRVIVAEIGGAAAGFLAVDGEGYVAGLFVGAAVQGRGVGTALLDAAMAARPEGLTLWTFEANAEARRFYERRGFVEASRTSGENDEGLPDVRLHWRPWA